MYNVNKVGDKSMNDLVVGENFFTLSNHNFMSVHGELLEEIMLIAKISGYDVVFTTSRSERDYISYSPTNTREINSEKSNDMIHIKQRDNKTLFYLTLTYYSDVFFFYECGLNPMNEKTQSIVQQCDAHKEIMHSKYFYATTDFNEVKKVLNCALEIIKNI